MSSHYGKKRGKKPSERAREARRAAFALYRDRLLRGDLTPAEAGLLVEYINEEIRVSDETHANLRATSRALDRLRDATDTAVLEAEERARQAEERATAPEPERPTVVLHTTTAPAAEEEHPAGIRYTTSFGALEEGPGRGVDELRRRAIAEALDAPVDTPWPALIGRAHDAHHWAKRARSSTEEAGELRDRLARSEEARRELRRRLADRPDARARQVAPAAEPDHEEQQDQPGGPCAQHPGAPVIGGVCGGCTVYPADMRPLPARGGIVSGTVVLSRALEAAQVGRG